MYLCTIKLSINNKCNSYGTIKYDRSFTETFRRK